MSLFEDYEKLEDRDRRVFSEVIQELQSRSYVLRGGAIRAEPRFLFIERHEELVSRYLEMGGWKLHLDRELGIARLYHPEGSGRVRFNKEESVLLLVLRLLYHEQKQRTSERPDAAVTVGQLRERLHALLPQAAVRPFLSRKTLGTRLRRLERFRILSFEGSSYAIEDDTVLILEPTLEHLISSRAVDETRARLDQLTAAPGAATQSPESAAESEIEEVAET